MAKRAAEDQLTKDNDESGRGDTEEEGSGEAQKAPAAELAGRPIRGMPKRKVADPGGGGASSSTSPAPNPFGALGSTLSSTWGAPPAGNTSTANPFSSLSNPASSAAPAPPAPPAPTPSFSFGMPSTAAPSAPPTFSFGAAPQAVNVPKPTSSTIYGGFGQSASTGSSSSFGQAAATGGGGSAPMKSNPFGGFSFGGGTPAAAPAASAASSGSMENPFSKVTAPPSNPLGSANQTGSLFSFGAAKPAEKSSDPSLAQGNPQLKTSDIASNTKSASTFSFVAPAGAEVSAAKPAFSFGPASSSTNSGLPSAVTKSSSSSDPTKRVSPGLPASSLSSTQTSGSEYQKNGPKAVGESQSIKPNANSSKDQDGDDNMGGTSGQMSRTGNTEEERQREYLQAVRGLNESVVRAFQTRIIGMPFADLGSAFDGMKKEYAKQMKEIQEKAGVQTKTDSVEPVMRRNETQHAPPTAPSGPLVFKAPAAFPLLTPVGESSASAQGGFRPSGISSASSSSPFTFGAPSASAATPQSSSQPDTTTTFSFATTQKPPNPTAEIFKPRSEAASMAERLIKEMDAEKSQPAQASPSDTTGTPPSQPASRKRAASPPANDSPAPNSKRSLFEIKPSVRSGTASTLIFGQSPDGTVKEVFKAATSAAPIPFSFGAGAPPASPSGSGASFSFGLPAPRRVASAGFGFGKTDSSPGTPAAADGNAPSSSAFNFGQKWPATPAASNLSQTTPSFNFGANSFGGAPAAPIGTPDATDDGQDASGETASSEPQIDLSTTNVGEEDEDVVWEDVVRVNRLVHANNGGTGQWGSWAPVTVKLLRDKSVGGESSNLGRRFVMRAATTGVIMQNFSLKIIVNAVNVPANTIRLSIAAGKSADQIAISFGKQEGWAEKLEELRGKLKSELSAAGLSTREL